MEAEWPPGFRVLFSGQASTGKTLAKTVLAEGLGESINSVGVSAVVCKYIGETEENV